MHQNKQKTERVRKKNTNYVAWKEILSMLNKNVDLNKHVGINKWLKTDRKSIIRNVI